MPNKEVNKLIIIGKELSEDIEVVTAAQKFQIAVIYMDEIDNENNNENDLNTLYVVKDFNNDVFETLVGRHKSIVGSIGLQQIASNEHSITLPKSPTHNYHMKNLRIGFAKFPDSEQIKNLVKLIRYMGGSSREEILCRDKMLPKITHLIACKSSGNKYRLAVNLGISIMSPDWVNAIWQQRFFLDINPCESEFVSKYRLKPFHGLFMSFINFSSEDEEEMKELTIKNGGQVADDFNVCTHFVVDAIQGETTQIDFNFNTIEKHQYVVYKEWFWASIQIENRADELEPAYVYPVPVSKNSTRKSSSFRYSVDKSMLKFASPFSPSFDCSSSMDTSEILKSQLDSSKKTLDFSLLSPRNKICLELMQTEINYINILNTIIEVFKEPLEKPEFALLDIIELKTIFGNIPPIIEVHEKIFQKIQNIVSNWNDDSEIGIIFLENAKELYNAYPPYVNYFEKTKEMIDECAKKNPRFHAFIKRCESKPECQRQTLKELLIRPVQRLPSIVILLKSLQEKTSVNSSDHKFLGEAIIKLDETLKKINEDKRKMEGRFLMFDIVNDIKDCPPTLLSSARQLISKCDVKILQSKNGSINEFEDNLSLLLFNDLLVLCKNRTIKRTNSLSSKTPSNYMNSNSNKKVTKKSFKHVEMIPLEDIRNIHLIKEEEIRSAFVDFRNVFVLIKRPKDGDRTFPNYPFLYNDKEVTKDDFLNTLSLLCSKSNNGLKENLIIKDVPQSTIEFSYAKTLTNSLSKSKRFSTMLNRGVSIRSGRQSLSHGVSTSSLNTQSSLSPYPLNPLPPSSPSISRRASSLYRTVSQFLSPIAMMPIKSSPRYLGSMTSLSENLDANGDGNFSLPTTPAPLRRKKCCTPNSNNEQKLQRTSVHQ